MTEADPLSCTFEDARRTNRLRGLSLSTRAKIEFFEDMVAFAHRFGARDRRVGQRPGGADPGQSASRVCEQTETIR